MACSWRLLFGAVALMALLPCSSLAQRGRGDWDPTEFLRRSDRNKNGMLEPDEVKDMRGREFVERAAETAKLDRSQPLSIEKFGEAMRASRGGDDRRDERREERRRDDDRRDDDRRGERRDSSLGSGSRTPTVAPTVQGFANSEKEVPKAPGFNVPLETPGGNLQDRYERKVIDTVERETLPRYDRNKDGFLSFEEAKSNNRWEPPLAEGDLDKDGRLSRFELYERYAKKLNLPPKGTIVASTPASSTKPSSTAASGGASNDTGKLQEYAKGLLNRYDDNKSGFLERDEWKEMKEEYHAADTNKDNVITVEELAVKLSGFGSSASPASSAGSGAPAQQGGDQRRGWGGGGREGWGGRGGSNDRERGDSSKTAQSTKKSYRIPTATERLPKGLPDWFARNDANADGQVMMAEYMTSLTEQMAADFLKYDLNTDGVITPAECLKVVEAEKAKGGRK